MRIAYSVGTTSFGSFPGVSLKLNGFSTAAINDLNKNKTRNATSGTRMASSNFSHSERSRGTPRSYRNGRTTGCLDFARHDNVVAGQALCLSTVLLNHQH